MKFILGFIVGIIFLLLTSYFAGMSGIISVAATAHGGIYDFVDGFLDKAADASVEHHAKDEKNPLISNAETLSTGFSHYKENCLVCHGAKGVEPVELAKGLNPHAPKLEEKGAQEMSDGEMYWVIANGIRSTGMPAFSPTHSSQEIWSLVSFVRHLPDLSPEETQKLKGLGLDEDHHDHQHRTH